MEITLLAAHRRHICTTQTLGQHIPGNVQQIRRSVPILNVLQCTASISQSYSCRGKAASVIDKQPPPLYWRHNITARMGFLPLPPSCILYNHKPTAAECNTPVTSVWCCRFHICQDYYISTWNSAWKVHRKNTEYLYSLILIEGQFCDLLSQFAPRLILFYLLLIRLRNSVCCTGVKKVLTFKMVAYDLHNLTMSSLSI